MTYFSVHNHTDASNFRLKDCINKTEDLLDYALEAGLKGLTITDHSTIANHIRATRHIENNPEKFKDFVLGFGNEIYLLNKEDVDKAKKENSKLKFPHFLVLAKNQKGYECLKKLTTREWENSFFFKGMERTPLYYDDILEIVDGYNDDIIFTSSCLGSPLSQMILKYNETKNKRDKLEIHKFITFFIDLVGKNNFYLELQPAIKHDKSNIETKREQQIVNDMLLKLGDVYGLKCIVSTDAHYLNKEHAYAHKIYLQAGDSKDREVEEFYSTTYVMNKKELLEYFNEDLLETLIKNTHDLASKVEKINFKQQTQVPDIDIPEYVNNNLFAPYLDSYKYINKYRHSKRPMDVYYLHLIGQGMVKLNQEFNKENLDRIEIELEQVWEISEKLNQPLSSYFVLTQDVVNLMWEVSLVGTARGSASCFYTNYLLEIVQINPLKYDLPYYRFLNKEKEELPDIDIDTEASKREDIIKLSKERYGHDKILNSCTFTTEGPKSTVITATRGLGLDVNEQHNIANSIPSEGSATWSIRDALYGNEKKNRKPSQDFNARVNQHNGLRDILLSIEGVISGRSQHASSVIFYPKNFLQANAMMKTTKGLEVTQFNAKDGEYAGELKLDYLSISALGRIREAMDLLLEDGKIEWQGNLRDTYNKYFHPDNMDLTSKEMYDMLSEGHIFDAFQMSSLVARTAMSKIRPETFDEVAVTNSIIRLQTDGEQPVDRFVRYKENIGSWFIDMENYGLTNPQMTLMKKHLLPRTGMCDTQELIMNIIIDPDIANGGLTFANKFRKAIGKKDQKKIAECEQEFRTMLLDKGHSNAFVDYIINEQFSLSYHYSFSLPHVVAYTMILMIEMNIAYRFGLSYWKTACLTINSGLEGNTTKTTDYGEVSTAVNSMKEDILPPSINKSELKFIAKDDKILYALKPIMGLDTTTLDAIIEHRPFKSLEDFYMRMVKTKIISPKKAITLVKSGAMDELEKIDRTKLMVELVKYIVPDKDKVTMVQYEYIKSIIPNKFNNLKELHEFRQLIEGRNKVPMNKDIEEKFITRYSKYVNFSFDKENKLVIDMKSWKKYYEKEIKPLKEELKKPEYAKELTRKKRLEYWIDECYGTVAEWEIETVLYNSNDFVVDINKISDKYEVTEFNNLNNLPLIKTNSRGFPEYEISAITGVVVNNNTQKKYVQLLTKDSGVIILKMNRKMYAQYNEKSTDNPSWFERGTKLVCLGYKNGEAFQLRGNNIYRRPIIKVDGNKNYIYTNQK